MGPRQPGCAILLALLVALARPVASQLFDKPLSLPGKPEVGISAAGAGPPPVERFGYFSPKTAPERKLFYWFYQARNMTTGAAVNASNTPLIAWFNGGPGCSSLWGMFFENGPWTLDASLQLVANPATWANVGHMIFIDQPIGTGLSYSTKAGDATTSQLDVARTVVAFLQAFLKSPTYSHLAGNPLYLTGESFAGHYLPAIGAYAKLTAPALKLAGIAMGNPCTNGPAMYQSYPNYALANTLVSLATYKSVTSSLASCKLKSAVCSVLDAGSCTSATDFCEGYIWGGLVAGGSPLGSKNPYNVKDMPRDCGGAQPYNCYGALDARAEAYINANRARLGAPNTITYQSCADPPYWSLLPDMAASYDDLVAALVDNGVRVMVYSGLDDFVCNWMSSKQWMDGLVWSRQAQWQSEAQQGWAGGTFKRAGPLSFVRVANAGHMVPLDQPQLSLQLINQWILNGQPTVSPTRRPGGRVVQF